MPLGTILFHSPGWNEGKARNGTLGTRRQTRIELRRSGTNRASVWFVSLRFVALHSLGKCRSYGAQKCGGNNYPRACALGFERVSPLQGSSQSMGVNKMMLWVYYRRIFLGIVFSSLGTLSEWVR